MKTAKKRASKKFGSRGDPDRVFWDSCALQALARIPGLTEAEIAGRLGFPSATAFAKKLKSSKKLRDAWTAAQRAAVDEAAQMLWEQAKDGSASALQKILEGLQQTVAAQNLAALEVKQIAELIGTSPQQIRNWITHKQCPRNSDNKTIDLKGFLEWYQRFLISSHQFDVYRVRQVDVLTWLGVSKPTLNEWVKTAGCPRNKDGSYNLPAVVQWRLDQLSAMPQVKSTDEAARMRAKKTALQIDQMEKKLIPAAEALAVRMFTAWKVTAWLDANLEKMQMDLAGLTPDRVLDELNRYFLDLRSAACERPENYYEMLPGEVAGKFMEILKMLETGKQEKEYEYIIRRS